MITDHDLIIIPTFNERENILPLLESIHVQYPQVRVLIVDDHSPDGTADIIEKKDSFKEFLHVMRRTGKRGLGLSYVDGYRYALNAGYNRAAQMDADFSHDPSYLESMFQAAEQADVVLGSRYCQGGGVKDWPYHRYLLSRFANRYVALITGLRVLDATSGFRVYTQSALKKLPLGNIVSNGYAFQVEMTFLSLKAGLSLKEVPIVFRDRTKGQSKISRKVLIESMLIPWKLRFGKTPDAVSIAIKKE
jgi:dolichol-phosphate mannosyltransferase